MPYHVRFVPEEAFAVVAFTGAIRWDDVAAALCALFGHPGWFPSFSILWDLRDVTRLDATPDDLPAARGLMEVLAEARMGGRSAVVVMREEEAALAALLARLGPPTGREVRTFFALAEALRFLGRRTMPDGVRERVRFDA